MSMSAVVIGGTGPTGHHIVRGLIERGFAVAILHTGQHEVDEIPESVEHIHTNPFDPGELTEAIAGRTFDLTVATYGRLRKVAEVFAGRTGRFVSVGGAPAYRGYMNAEAIRPVGLPVPTPEDAPFATEGDDTKGYRVRLTEEHVFDLHPSATHFRYPYLYGPYQFVVREWPIVRRILDQRPHIVLADGGLTLNHNGFAANVAHAVLLGIDNEGVAAGETYNCGDETVLTLRQVVDLCAEALDHEWDVVSIPYELAAAARPLVGQPWTTHRVLDLTKIRSQLGYRDIVSPPEAVKQAARWLVSNPIAAGSPQHEALQDPFDYAAEDELVAAWRALIDQLPNVAYAFEPGYTISYSGPGGSARKGAW